MEVSPRKTEPATGTRAIHAGTARSAAEVEAIERDFIAQRRRSAGFRDIDSGSESETADESSTGSHESLSTVGLALSGGGIRSASLSLGFIQALRKYGLFRYVDYLSAISGGSYTAALVASSFYRATGERASSNGPDTYRLDIDIVGGSQQPTRVRALANDGRYLMRPVEWANRFFSGWFLLLIFIGSGLLAASALIAFLWRSMDFYTVRDYLAALGMGGDLWPALLPVITLFILWLALWTFSRLRNEASARGRRAKKVLIALVLCGVTTVAALIGNGDISLTAGAEKTLDFLKYPLIVAVLAGLLPVFFRERLFKSGRKDSSLPERILFRYTAIAVVLGIPMLLIGFFARENISGFGTSRDGQLLVGDIKDFAAFSKWFESIVEEDAYRKRRQITHDLLRQSNMPLLAHTLMARVLRGGESPIGLSFETEVNDKVGELCSETLTLMAARRELRTRITGQPRWRANQPAPAEIIRIEDSGVADKTLVIGTTGPWSPAAVTAAEVDALESLPPRDPTAGSSAVWKSWVRWKYDWLVTRCSLVVGHILHSDLDDPLGLAIKCQNRIRHRQAQLLTAFNEYYLASARFNRLFDLDEVPTDAPSALKEEVAKLRVSGIESFDPESLVEFNRRLLEAFRPELVRPRDEIRRTVVIHADQTHRFFLFMAFAGIFIVSGLWINPNTTSIQRYYQECLATAYLGGSDEAHNVRMTELTSRLGSGPMVVIGGTANYRFRATRERQPHDAEHDERCAEEAERVDHFEFTPLYCGSRNLGFIATDSYCNGSVRLADAVAISGAALNPMYFERWEMFVLFGLLNLRLGQWLPNPAQGVHALRPTFATFARDLVDLRNRGFTSAKQRRHILITDGGHFDNLGLQALLERRCKLILVCDSSHDASYTFDDFAHLIGRMKGRAGITFHEIGSSEEINLSSQATDVRDNHRHFFCAEIRYANDNAPSSFGMLVYFKNSLSGDEPPFVWNHAANHEQFPHDSTLNQSFLPDQFWAYLGLGQHLVDDLVEGRRRAVQDMAVSRDFNLKAFAKLFLAHVEKDRRDEFLDTLFPENRVAEVRRNRSDYMEALEKLREAVKAHNWREVLTSIDSLTIDVNDTEMGSLTRRGQLLDTLAVAIATAADDTIGDASFIEAVRTRAVDLFVSVLFTSANIRGNGAARAANRDAHISLQLRQRLSKPETAAAVRQIVRHQRFVEDVELLQALARDGDVLGELVAGESIKRIGEMLFLGETLPRGEILPLIHQWTLSDSAGVRRRAMLLLRMLDQPERDNETLDRASEERIENLMAFGAIDADSESAH